MISCANHSDLPGACDRPRQQLRIADAPGPRKRGASVRERAPNVDLPQAILAQIAQDLRAQRVVAPASASASSPSLINVGRSPSATAPRACAAPPRARPGRNLSAQLLEHRSRPLAVARQDVEPGGLQATAAACLCILGRVSSPASSHSSAAAAVAPRPAAARLPHPAQQQPSPRAHRRPMPGGGRAPPHPRLPRRGRGGPRRFHKGACP